MNITNYLPPGAVAADYVFDDDLIDFNSSNPVLKNILPADLLIKANFNTSTSLDYSRDDGSLPASTFGGAGVVGGKLSLPSGAYVRYAGTNNSSPAIQTGCIELNVYPGYSGTPSNLSVIFIEHQAEGNFSNMVRIDHDLTGNLVLYFYNSSGTPIIQSALGVWSPTVDAEYIFSLNWDVTTGATRLFINGAQFGATVSTTLTRSSSVGIFQLGYDTPFSFVGKIDNVVVFDTVQHTANYTPTPVTTYSTANPTIKSLTPIDCSQLIALTANFDTPSGTSLPFVIEVNGVDMWFNGNTWAVSSIYLESNTTITRDQLALLDLGDISEVNPKFFFVTTGEVTPQLFSYSVGCNSHGFAEIVGVFVESDGSPAIDGKISVTPSMLSLPVNTNTQVDYSTLEYFIDSDTGAWTIPDLIVGVTYDFKFYSKVSGLMILRGRKRKVVDTIGTHEFNDLGDA